MVVTSFCMFWFRFILEMFSALSAALLCGRAFVCFSARLAVHNFAVYSVLGSQSKQTATSAMAVKACVIIPCLFLCCCLQKFPKQQREIGTSILLIRENVNFTTANF